MRLLTLRHTVVTGVVLTALMAMPGHGSTAAASLRQAPPPVAYPTPGDADGDRVPDARDKCRAEFGTVGAAGCPDADGDGSPDSVDKCPTEAPATGDGTGENDGCFAVAFNFQASLPGRDSPGAKIYASCPPSVTCKVSGAAVLTVSSAVERKLHLSSTLIGRFGFTHRCQQTACALVGPSDAIVKKLVKADAAAGDSLYVPVKVSLEMTSPRRETLTDTYRFGIGSGGEGVRLCGAGWSPLHLHSPACGGKPVGDGEG